MDLQSSVYWAISVEGERTTCASIAFSLKLRRLTPGVHSLTYLRAKFVPAVQPSYQAHLGPIICM
jgi:hypothetical protein